MKKKSQEVRHLEEKQVGKCDVQGGPGQAVQDRNCITLGDTWTVRCGQNILLLPAVPGLGGRGGCMIMRELGK